MWSLLLIWTAFRGIFASENCEKIVDNETCILGEGTCHLDWPGELVIPEKRQMMCPSVALTADRFVMKSDSNLYAKSTIKIYARTMTFDNCVLKSFSTFLLEKQEKDHAACEGIQVVSTGLFVQQKLVMKCQDGTVNVTGKSALQARFNDDDQQLTTGSLILRGKFVSFPDFYVKLSGDRINISAEQLRLGASISGTPNLVAMAQYEAILGWLGGTWSLDSLVAAAEKLIFAMDHRVEVLGTSCDNQELPRRRDYCQELLHSWPWSEKILGDALTWVPGVKFTSVIFASKHLDMKPRTRFLSASALFCAGEELNLENSSSILSQGKGCPGGKGDGAGEVRTHFAVCGGGGASNMGAGGDGALRVEGEKALWHCAEKGFVTEWDGVSLPLKGASGGGCSSGLRPQLSTSLEFSAGGGLLWLSTPKLYLNASSRVKADGLQGTMVGKSAKLAMATGGGAGGQILIFAKDIRVEECMEDEGCDPPELSAEGGDAHCSSAQNTVGGAGGGGFIGLWWLGGAPTAHEDLGQLVKLQVAGGTLTKICADVLPQDLHLDVFGRPGMAVSLAPCPEGHAGPFCASCPIGQWGNGHGHGRCHHCDNKPKTPNAVYAKMAWPNSSCPFHCVPGVPEVKVNPNCLSNFDFAMGFFGGKLGFKITLAIPITIFFIIRLAHSLRRKRRTRPACGRWQFPREELPCHVARIYLLGNNSAGSPWTLPERGPTAWHDEGAAADAATVQEMVGDDVWQALGEALQKLGRGGERFCRSGSFYQRLAADAGLVPCHEDEETCTSAATSFFCNSTCIEGNLSSAPDPTGHETFCRSLCSKKKVKHCSLLSSEACDSEEYYAEDPRDGFMLCQTAGDGRCSASVAAAVNSVHCELSRFCDTKTSTNGTNSSHSDLVPSSATTTDTTTARSTTTAEGEVPLFSSKSCVGETCPEVTADLCDGDWKQTGECSCHCKRYRPHIVMLLVNSMGFNDFVDSSDVSTGWPFLKTVLPTAIRINSSYVEVGSAPSRAAFLTGRWPRYLDWAASPSLASSDAATGAEGWRPINVSRHRQLGSTTGAFAQVGERTIAEKLNSVGYKSYAVGKWQAGGVSWKMTPGGRGFSRFYGSYDDASDYVKHCDMQGHYDLHYEETEQFEVNGSWRFRRPYHYFPSGKDVVGKHVNSLFQAKAKQFIEDHRAKYKGVPMFLYYAPMTFQEPLQAPTWTAGNCTFQEGFGSAANSNRQTFCRMATSLDRSIQEIAKTMRGSFLGDNWVIVVASDSGGSASHKGSGGSNWPLRGSRGEVWEGGIRTKALIFGSHPELEAATSRNQTYSGGFLHLVDWHATLLHMAHATPSSRAPPNDVDGVSLWRQILNDSPSPREDMIFNASAFNTGGGLCIRSGDFKLIMAPSGGKNPMTGENQGFRWPVRVIGNADYLSLYDVDPLGSTWTKGADWKLFNIRTDPSESTDLALLFPEEVKRLENRLDELLKGRRTFGDSLLKCTAETCAKVAAKAIQVMRNHSGEIELNQCPIQEAAYPFWEEASELARAE
eukprot:s477_g11.t2